MRPVIGKDYYPNPTLRQMPSHWILEEARKDPTRWHWWKSGDFWVGLIAIVVGVIASLVTIAETLK